jgi:Bacterial protein of unknown function (DUF885)
MKWISLVCALLTVNSLSSAEGPMSGGVPGWIARSDDNARVLLEVLAKFSPEYAGRLGVDGFDEEISDLKPGITERTNAALRDASRVLSERLAQEKEQPVQQDLEILLTSAADNIRSNELQDKYLLPYFDVPRIVFSGLRALLDDQIPEERRKAALIRLRKYAGLEKGYAPLTTLAEDRTRERFNQPQLLGPSKAEVEKNLENTVFFETGIEKLFEKYHIDGYQAPFAELKKQFTSYTGFVQKEIMPRTRDDFRLPGELYADNLHQYGVDISPDSLTRLAHQAFDSIQKQMQALAATIAAKHGWPDSDYRSVLRKLKEDQLVGDAILPYYQNTVKEIEGIIRKEQLVTLPERAMRIRIASEAETAQQPAPHMVPPRLIGNTGEVGEFVLPLNIPTTDSTKNLQYDDFTYKADAWTLTAHEGRPGHEMQFSSMIERGVSTARAIFSFNSVNVEGWGLYAEAIMLPYMPMEGQLASLDARLLRAARAFIDPELQSGKLTIEDGRRILKDDVIASDAMATQELERYTFRSPGQATSYYYGFMRLMDLRTRLEKALGSRFNQKKFHDFILSQGLLPPALVQKAAFREFGITK